MPIIRLDAVVPEAISVADLLIWVYRDQKADRVTGKDLLTGAKPRKKAAPPTARKDSCLAVEQARLLGAVIPGTGHRQRYRLHPDAEAVHDQMITLSAIDPLGPALLRHYARIASVPDAGGGIPAPAPVHRIDIDGEHLVDDAFLPDEGHFERHMIKGRVVLVRVRYPFCPIRYWPSPEARDDARNQYRVWWTALNRLAETLPPLRRWIPKGLGASAPMG